MLIIWGFLLFLASRGVCDLEVKVTDLFTVFGHIFLSDHL